MGSGGLQPLRFHISSQGQGASLALSNGNRVPRDAQHLKSRNTPVTHMPPFLEAATKIPGPGPGPGPGWGWAEGLDHRRATGSWMVTSAP